MGYVAIGILFLLVVAAGITMFVLVNTRRSAQVTADDRESLATPFSGPDETPLGDTAQHSAGPDGSARGPARAVGGEGRFKRDPVGGEAEGTPTIPAQRRRPPR